MARKYDVEVQKAWKSLKKPVRFVIDIREYNENTLQPDAVYFVQMCVYEDEFTQMSDKDRLKSTEYLSLVQNVIESYGIRCVLGLLPGSPPQITSKGK